MNGMGRKVGQDRIEVREGLYLYVRESGTWQVYFKLKGEKKSIRRSLNTKDLEKAKRLASHEFDQARARLKSGKPALGIGFQKLCAEYLESLSDGEPKDYHSDTIRRHLRYTTLHFMSMGLTTI